MKVHDLLTQKGITGADLARVLHRSDTRVLAILLQQRGAAWSTIEKIARHLGVPPEEIAEQAVRVNAPLEKYGRWI